MLFPKWTNKATWIAVIFATNVLLVTFFTVFVFWYWFSPKNLDVGYSPEQPIKYSHELHAGQLGIDCRYCHFNVEKSAFATIPSADVCMNCHSVVKTDSPEVQKLKSYHDKGEPIPWVRVHSLPDYAYFDHSAHLNAGIGCSTCHGRVDNMEVVHQTAPLSMGWCLDCHRNPLPNIRDKKDLTKMNWTPDLAEIKAHENINPREDCSTCHR